MSKAIHFEIPVTDPEKASKFYEAVFGWKMFKYGDMDYWLVQAGEESEGGINGALIKKVGGEITQDITSAEGSVNAVITFNVEDVDETMKRVAENGGKVVTEKNEIPEVGTHFYFHDLDGNLIGAMKPAPME
jgi:predicted enzyme related to lactoylglutathione lyase